MGVIPGLDLTGRHSRQPLLRLAAGFVVAAHHHHRNAVLGRNPNVEADLSDRAAVEAERLESRRRVRVLQHRSGGSGHRVITEQNHRIGSFRAGKTAARRNALHQIGPGIDHLAGHIEAAAVPVPDHNLIGTRPETALDAGVDIARHETTRRGEQFRPGVVDITAAGNAADPFDVAENINLHCTPPNMMLRIPVKINWEASAARNRPVNLLRIFSPFFFSRRSSAAEK